MKRVTVDGNLHNISSLSTWCRKNVSRNTKHHWKDGTWTKIRKGTSKWNVEWGKGDPINIYHFYFRDDKDAFRFAMECL